MFCGSLKSVLSRTSRWPACASPPACTSPPRPPTSAARSRPAARSSRSAPPTRCQHAGRRRRRAGRGLRHPDLRHPGRGQATPTTGTSTPRWTSAEHHHGRRRRPRQHAAHQAHRTARRHHRRHGGDDHRRHPPARAWSATARCATRSSPSTTPRPSTSSTTATAPASPPLDGIIRATNILLAGQERRRLRLRLVRPRRRRCAPRGMGANVIVTEVDPLRALEAVMDGFQVMPMAEAAKIGDIFITVTGDIHVHPRGAFRGHEGRRDRLQLRPLQCRDRPRRRSRRCAERQPAASASSSTSSRSPDGRRIYLLGEGRLINLAAAEGHPAAVMDMSFANQALCSECVATRQSPLARRGPPPCRGEIDEMVARLKLQSMGIAHRHADARAGKYLTSWQHGT